MPKYTVSLSQAYVRYAHIQIEVEATDQNAAAEIAKDRSREVAWHWDPPESADLGHCDIEVTGGNQPMLSWRED